MDTEPTTSEWETAQRVLRAVRHDPTLADNRPEFRRLVADVNRMGRKHVRQRAARQSPEAEAREMPRCYMCKRPFATAYPTHPSLCQSCGELNNAKRHARADLTGRVALLTGGRLKIGYATALKLLRDGARVIVTTRFPADAARRYGAEPDALDWLGRLSLYGLDLRDLRGVRVFIQHMNDSEPHLDLLINNAAQTIARPAQFYAHLLDGERHALPGPDAGLPLILQPAPTHLFNVDDRLDALFPPGTLDAHGQQRDLRPTNSWTATLEDVEARELLEVQLTNLTAPFLLCQQLLPMLRRSPHERRFVVNVSALEGQFARSDKRGLHPHTNMAKAALNMLTLTSGPPLAREGVYMTSVDTGWVSVQQPYAHGERLLGRGFQLPLDMQDAAARVYDPIVTGLRDTPLFGVLLKDYLPQPW